MVHALLIARRGNLVYEGYFNGWAREVPHTLQSVTKSVGSALIGIAVDQGLLRLDDQLDDLLPGRAASFMEDPDKRNIRLQDLLSMEAGLDWDEQTCPYTSSCNDNYQMNQSSDWGLWKGCRILSADWVARTGSVQATVGGSDRYGFQWWLRPMEAGPNHVPTDTDMVYGWGYGGQHVFVVRALDLVVVFLWRQRRRQLARPPDDGHLDRPPRSAEPSGSPKVV